MNEDDLPQEVAILGDSLRKYLYLPIAEFDANDSAFFKAVYEPPPRIGAMIQEMT